MKNPVIFLKGLPIHFQKLLYKSILFGLLLVGSVVFFMVNSHIHGENVRMRRFILNRDKIIQQFEVLQKDQDRAKNLLVGVPDESAADDIKNEYLNRAVTLAKSMGITVDSYSGAIEPQDEYMIFHTRISGTGGYSDIVKFFLNLGKSDSGYFVAAYTLTRINLQNLTLDLTLDLWGEKK